MFFVEFRLVVAATEMARSVLLGLFYILSTVLFGKWLAYQFASSAL
jgi:hypothetical protein